MTLEVATTRETKFSHLEERAERVQTKACEAMSPEDTELKRVQLFQPKRKRKQLLHLSKAKVLDKRTAY